MLGVKTLVCHSLPSLSPPWLLCRLALPPTLVSIQIQILPNSDEHCHECLIWQGMEVGDVEVEGFNLQSEAGWVEVDHLWAKTW